MHVHILTLFPDFFDSPVRTSIVGRAVLAGLLTIGVHDIREHTQDRHRTADDSPYGGGAGMVMKPEPIVGCIEAVEAQHGRLHRVLLSPQGTRFSQAHAHELAQKPGLMLLCGRYEGIDERVREHYIDHVISIGDYVLTGGELAALVVLDAVIRLCPGVLGNAESAKDESFSDGLTLEYPQYTRPYDFRGHLVPDVLRSGDHGRVAQWRRHRAALRTARMRPDLFVQLWETLSAEDQRAVRLLDPECVGAIVG